MARGTKRAASPYPDIEQPPSPLSPIPSSCASLPTTPVNNPRVKKIKRIERRANVSDGSPFPDYPAPTSDEAAEVHALLARTHPEHALARKKASDSSERNSAETCGAVANVLDSLVGTILSQNTTGRNSTAAKRCLDATFGLHGFEAIVGAPQAKVIDAIRSGGLANRKAAIIQDLLREVHIRHGAYSLQDLESLTDEEAMKELCSYRGVGLKTAACVLLFALGRDTFAVDTHVFRLSKLLRWAPPSADRIHAQLHLDARIPNQLKYNLHVLMVAHGRVCKGCKGNPVRAEPCALKTYMNEHRERS